jgi:hypothetical protein
MRLYALLNVQDIFLYLFPTLVFVLLFGLALSRAFFRTKRSEAKEIQVSYRFPEDIEEGCGAFPLVLVLTLVGTIAWGFFYILAIGLLEVRI